MATQETPQDLKPILEILTAKLETLSSRVDNVSMKVDAAAMKAGLPTDQKQPWWTTLTAVLGIPGLIFLMYLQFSQGGEAKANTQKSIAETEKVRTEELKARAELQTELETLTAKKTQGITLYQKQLNESLPKLQQTIEKLNAATLAKQSVNRDLLLQYVLLWIFIWGIGLMFNLISMAWNYATSVPFTLFFSLRNSHSKLSERIQRIAPVAITVLGAVPGILRVSVEVFIFFALFVPLFDQVATSSGSPVRFQGVAHSVRSLQIGEAIGQVRHALFP
jgi:hypothetical protein